MKKKRVNTTGGNKGEFVGEGRGDIYYIHTYIYIYIKERTITMSSLIIPKYTGAAILLSCRNFINSYRRGFFVQLFSIVACIDRYLFRGRKYRRMPVRFSLVALGTRESFEEHATDDETVIIRRKLKEKNEKKKKKQEKKI